jgi:hypothetical protein
MFCNHLDALTPTDRLAPVDGTLEGWLDLCESHNRDHRRRILVVELVHVG